MGIEDKETTGYLPWDIASEFLTEAFIELGVPKDDAEVCVEIMLESDRRGIKSHGCNRFRPIYMERIRSGVQKPVTKFEVIFEGPTASVVDGNNGMGMVISHRAMNMAIDKAKTYGMGMVAVRNSTHYGIAGYYTSMAAKAGVIGISGSNTRPSVAPTGGVENLLGTNPISVAFPTDEEFPFVFDCATSMMPRGKVEYYARTGHDLPKGAVIDREGKEVRDAAWAVDALDKNFAALTPLGGLGTETAGHKGYGLSTIVEVLSAALQDGPYLRLLNGVSADGTRSKNSFGHFFIAIDPEAFAGVEIFKNIAGNILRELRTSKKAAGEEHIYTAGEKEYSIWKDLKDKGIPLNKKLEQDFIEVRNILGLKKYHFCFEGGNDCHKRK